MKLRLFPALLGSSIVLTAFTGAVEVTWDNAPGTVGTGDGTVTGGTGNWDTTNGSWTVDDGVNNIAWNSANNDTAVFGGTAGTVTLGTGITANGLFFNSSGYVISGNTLTLAGTTPTLTVNGAATDTASIGSAIAGSAGLTKSGSGILTMTGTSSLTGNINVDGGTLKLNGTRGFDTGFFGGTRTFTVASGAILDVASAWNISTANVFTLNGGAINFSLNSGETNANYLNNLTATNGTISGVAFRTGNGASSYSFSGDTGNTISATMGMVKVGATNQIVTLDVANGAAASDLTISGVINDVTGFAGSTLRKTGTGTMLLTANNTYSGNTVISQGTVVTNANNGFGTSGTVTINDASTGANDTSLLAQTASTGDLVLSRAITVASDGSGVVTIGTNRTGSGRTFFNGVVTINRDVTLSATLTDRTQYRGGIRGTGNLTITGGSRTTFGDDINQAEAGEGASLYDFTGNVGLTGTGTLLQFNSDIELTNVGMVTVGTGTTLRSAYGKTIRIDGLSGSGTVTSVAGSGTLVVGINNGGGTYSGLISGSGVDALKLTKTGSGNQILSGATANTYTGLTTVNAGTLTLAKNDGVTAVAGNILVTGTGTLATDAEKSGRIADTSNITIDGSGASFQFGANQNDTINTLAVNNGGTVNIGGTGANLRPNGGITSTGGGAITMTAGGAGLNFNGATRTATVSDNTLTVSAPIYNGGLTKAGNGTLTLSSVSTYTGATIVDAGTLLVSGALGASNVSVAANAVFGGTGALAGDLGFDGNSFLTIMDIADALIVTGNVTFGSGFGIDNILGLDWDALDLNTPYTLLDTTQTFDSGSIGNFGIDNKAAVGTGRFAYFQSGSLQLVVIPEPSSAAIACLGSLLLTLRRSRTA